MSLCLTCPKTGRGTVHAKNGDVPQWILRRIARGEQTSSLPPNAPPPTSRCFSPPNSTLEVTLRLPPGRKDGKVLYWAARPFEDMGTRIAGAASSYGAYPNLGVSEIRAGVVKFRIQAPRPYREEGRTWPAHVHYSVANKTGWSTKKVYAVAAYPGTHGPVTVRCVKKRPRGHLCSIVTPAELKKNWHKFAYVINALDVSFEIRHKGRSSLNTSGVVEAVPKSLGQKPYLVFCAHEKCHAASRLIRKLVRRGHMNVYYMPAGKRGFA